MEHILTRLHHARNKQIVDNSIGQIQKASAEAVDVLREILHDREAPAASRISATKIILELSLKGLEITDIIQRLDSIEQAMLTQ
ncbi:MAG: hypothetical protein C0611_05990 [Desulfobacteraceae bacterium]|nr:MAG: hypothetical protein C0611_05990 [Desulfobacteraceae bacterium]